MNYDPLKVFWEHNSPAQRLMYVREWKIYKYMHPLLITLTWEELLEEPKDIIKLIRNAHRKAVKKND